MKTTETAQNQGKLHQEMEFFCQTYLHTYVSLQMKSMIADQDKETSDEQTLSEEKDRFDDEKGKKKHGFQLSTIHRRAQLLEH